jgi:hypothetical protein
MWILSAPPVSHGVEWLVALGTCGFRPNLTALRQRVLRLLLFRTFTNNQKCPLILAIALIQSIFGLKFVSGLRSRATHRPQMCLRPVRGSERAARLCKNSYRKSHRFRQHRDRLRPHAVHDTNARDWCTGVVRVNCSLEWRAMDECSLRYLRKSKKCPSTPAVLRRLDRRYGRM